MGMMGGDDKIDKCDMNKCDDCSICFEEICDKKLEVATLPCNHLLHLDCYKKLIEHKQMKCPYCRMEFFENEVLYNGKTFNCKKCDGVMNKNDIGYLRNDICGCIFHVDCLRNVLKEKTVNYPRDAALFMLECPFCGNTTVNKNWCTHIFPAHCNNQENAFISWVSPLYPCSYNFIGGKCDNYGNPSRHGNFCGNHSSSNPCSYEPKSWEEVENALYIILRYYSHFSKENRFLTFQNILFGSKS